MKLMSSPGPYSAKTRGTRSDDRVATRMAVSFSEEQFEGVRLYAEAHGMPIASAIRHLALLALKEVAQ
jgi:hypothetical protein